jgi:hypothetical protein
LLQWAPDGNFYQGVAYVPGDTPIYGPWYSIPKLLNCDIATGELPYKDAKEVASGILNGLVSLKGLATWVTILAVCRALLKGGISAAAFWDALMALIPATDLPGVLILAGAGIELQEIFSFIKCDLA